MDLVPNISQHQEISQGTDSYDEIIASVLSSGKKRLSTSDVTENRQENQDYSKNIVPGVETTGSVIMDTPLHPELNPCNDNGVRAGEAELLDDLSEPELDDRENTEQRIIDDRDMSEPGDMSGASFCQKASLKRRHKMVIDDDDDDE